MKRFSFTLFCAFVFVCACVTNSQGQKQVIGSFPYMEGGFENQAAGTLAAATAAPSATAWTSQVQTGTTGGRITATGGRSGPAYATGFLPTSNLSTYRVLQSPQSANASDGPAAGTQYTIQCYTRNTAAAAGTAFALGINTNGLTAADLLAGTNTSIPGNSDWTFRSATITTSSDAIFSAAIGVVKLQRGTNIDVDDFVIYPGALDATAPGAATAPVTSNVSATSVTMGWTAPSVASGGVDGGGYMIVRYTSDPTGATAPKVNGIYAVGNTIGTGTVVYIGTTASFTDNTVTANTHYYYAVYTVDKAFNYSSPVTVNAVIPAMYRSNQSGDWSDPATWQYFDGTSWVDATVAPDNTAAAITIHTTVTVASPVTAGHVLVAAGATLTVNNGIVLTIADDGTAATDLQINGAVNNSGVITPTNAQVVVSASGSFTCLSTSPTTTGAIGNVGTGSITGNITMKQNLSAQRAYRLLGHPFNAGIPISALESYIDITGSGTGLTAGNASAFNYLPGVWTAYTDATQTWDKNEALFLFVRGTPGEGIGQTTGTYTPSSPTLSLTGQVNTGDLNYTVKSVAGFGGSPAQGWNAIGNPYPAPIDVNAIDGITGPGGSGSSIYVWNATMGSTDPGIASGGYDFQTLGGSFIIPAYGAFFIQNASGLDQPITFRESIKRVSGAPVYAPFGGSTTPAQSFLLTIADSLTYWDKLKISFDDQFSTASTDRLDLEKFSNINLDFYSIGSDNKHLAINNRPVLQSATDVIALGLKTNQQRTFTVKASGVSLATGSNLYLHDKYTNNWMKIANGMSYNFTVTADTASQGNNRFELASKPADLVVVTPAPSHLTVQAGPNPVKELLTISYASPEALQTNIRITDISGKTVNNIHAGKVQSGTQQVATGTWSSGMYVIQVNNGKEVVTQKVVKQ